MLAKKVVPIINENDSVATEEIETRIFGDNDQLSAMVACYFEAEVLIILSDVDALYEKNPHPYPDAMPVKIVSKLDTYIQNASDETENSVGTGGMKTKLLAARIAEKNNCMTIIAKANSQNILRYIVLHRKDYGIFFLPRTHCSPYLEITHASTHYTMPFCEKLPLIIRHRSMYSFTPRTRPHVTNIREPQCSLLFSSLSYAAFFLKKSLHLQ